MLVFSDILQEADRIKIEMALFDKIEEQKVDIVITNDASHPFVKIALKTGVRL